ncbi:hypothetical protein H2198_007768 [Neophaeococcomyces mojaviensis]|uniref:Uncharacterized protein n=1 Tax=Neophaeococcomyces mojaviensis TaxID=3383035 RepID=A0ACC2ZZ87_9EURO|nr:hypothetical protein H2198_007768 [Knufia sp. JES_112]
MSSGGAPTICLWDGISRTSAIWNYQVGEPELSVRDANCFVHLSTGDTCTGPSFKIRFDTLVSSSCQPLIEEALVFQPPRPSSVIPSGSSRLSKASTTPKLFCSLFIEPPKDCKASEIIQYHITSRNFFAWMMSLPIVGPDIVSALIALKIRMDAWRSQTADNLAAIYEYAKAQGYGELGDLQAVLSKHVSGIIIQPMDYTMVTPTDGHREPEAIGGAITLTRFITRKIQLVGRRMFESQVWTKRSNLLPPESHCSSRTSISLEAADSALSLPHGETTISSVLVPTKKVRPAYLTSQSAVENPQCTCALRLSLPDFSKIPGGTIDAISHDLENQICWRQNSSRKTSSRLSTQFNNAAVSSAFYTNTSSSSALSSSDQEARNDKTIPTTLSSPVSPTKEHETVDDAMPLPPSPMALRPDMPDQRNEVPSMIPLPMSPTKEDEVINYSAPQAPPCLITRNTKRVTWSPTVTSTHHAQPPPSLATSALPALRKDQHLGELTRFPSLHKDKTSSDVPSESIRRSSQPACFGAESALKCLERDTCTVMINTDISHHNTKSELHLGLHSTNKPTINGSIQQSNSGIQKLVTRPPSASTEKTETSRITIMPDKKDSNHISNDTDKPMLVRQLSDQPLEAALVTPVEEVLRSYRIPLEPHAALETQAVGISDSHIMDHLLEELTSIEHRSAVESEARVGDVRYSDSAAHTDELLANMQIPKYGPYLIEKEPSFSYRKQAKILKLRKWFSNSGRVKKQMAEATTSHVVNVLVLDENGHFSAMSSPAMEPPYHHDELLPARARTPMCELDV